MTLIFRFISASLLLLLPLLQPLWARQPIETKRVLVLYSEDKAHPAHELTDQGIRSAFRSNTLFDVQLYNEYLDVSRFSGPAHARAFADNLGRKYAGLKIDAIITVYLAALDFLMGEEGNVFPGVPIVACEIDRSTAENLERSPSRRLITGLILGDNIAGILDSAFRMKPGTKRVALVAGTSPSDVFGEVLLRRGLTLYARKLDLIDLTKLPMQEILAQAGSLPPDTIVLYSAIFRDGAGQSFVPREALSLISAASNGPVFGFYDSFIGYGIVGGRLVSFEQQGREAATLALRIMGGESPASIPFGGEQAYVTLYDWRELKRWNIPETAVPPGSEVRYREPSLWRDYKGAIIGVIGLIIIETFLILGLVINLQRRRKAERSLRESEERMTLAAEAAEFAVWMWSIPSNQVWGSERWLRLFGFAPDAAVSFEMVIQRIHPDDREMVVREVRRALADRGDYAVEYRVILPEGTQNWIASRGRMYPHAHGKPARMLGAAIDITRRKRAEQEIAQQRNELIHVTRVSTMGQLASSLAHELNQPLGAILRNTEAAELFLQDPAPDLDELRAILADIRKDDQRAGAVIDRMRALMKHREPERRRLDFNLLAGDVGTLVRPEAEMRGVRLAVETDPALPPVHGDRVQLQQVLVNLLLNAMDALDDNPPARRLVTVRAGHVGATVEITVSDTGHGISADNLLRVFEPFFSSKPNGLGMGLAISRRIIQAHGGQLWAGNNEAGGATFTFTLPAAEGGDAK